MWYVYIIKSKKDGSFYIGSTDNIKRRYYEHNKGKCLSTKNKLPVVLESYIAVKNESIARRLEKYLKTGSGRAILKKRILTDEAKA
ncbi:MAG: GIY-YIG nuclease family protein [Armatimonadetes bacterium]|nr:GIY-YIG nuclease family protein [Armatimonadota bacterium]